MKWILAGLGAGALLTGSYAYAQYYVPPGCKKVSPGACWTASDCRACCQSTASDVNACVQQFHCNTKYPASCKKQSKKEK